MENYLKNIFLYSMIFMTVAYFIYILKDMNSSIERINSTVNGLKSELNEVNSTVTGLVSGFNRLNSEINSLKTGFDSLNSEINSLKTGFDSFKSEIKQKLNEMSGEEGLEMAKKFSGRIQIWPSSDRNKSYASGGIVEIESKSFYLTNMHVVYDEENKCRRKIKKIELINGTLLNFFFDDVLIHPYLDLALVPLSNFTGGAKISRKPLTLMNYLVGVSFREKGEVGLHGRVLEKREYFSLSDFGGTRDFRGTNYFTKEQVTAVHLGKGNFIHTFKNEDYYEKTFSLTFKWISEYVKYHFRNPRTKLVEAYRVYEIKKEHLLNIIKGPKLCTAERAA